MEEARAGKYQPGFSAIILETDRSGNRSNAARRATVKYKTPQLTCHNRGWPADASVEVPACSFSRPHGIFTYGLHTFQAQTMIRQMISHGVALFLSSPRFRRPPLKRLSPRTRPLLAGSEM